MKKVFRWFWEFPQCLVGVILVLFYKGTLLRKLEYKDSIVYIYDKFPGGISLGQYLHVDFNKLQWNKDWARESLRDSIKHEYGHSLDSKWQGPLYLLLTGLPSVLWLFIRRLHNKWCKEENKWNYYWFWTERRADKLGGVERSEGHNLYLNRDE